MIPLRTAPGDLVAGRFAIEELTGSGGMASVYRARDLVAGTRVALKVLRGGHEADRFTREASVLAELDHPAIVRYVAHGQIDEETLFLAMEWLDGEDLSRRLKRVGLTLEECVLLGARVAGALAVVHASGIVHRDLKPGNLFLCGGEVGRVKLIDFGVARLLGGAMTQTGSMLGTPGYIAPEQARGLPSVDPRADVFSLGCVLYRCLAGRAPFRGDDVLAVLAKLVFEEPPRVREARPEIPPELDALVGRMMAKDPAERPADGAAVVREFERLGARRGEGPAPPAAAITSLEQRLVSVVVTAPANVDAAVASVRAPFDPVPDLGAALRPFGADLVVLADGSAIVTLAGQGEPTDRAARAARCALAIRSHLPDREMVLATGRDAASGPLPFGEVIDRAVRMLRPAVKAGGAPRVRVDEVTAGLLGSGFDVGGDAVSLFVRREYEPLEAAPRTLLGRATSCFGRDSELATLDAIHEACVGEPAASAVVVVGPAGAGKSRVLHEFLHRLAARGTPSAIWTARGDPTAVGSPLRMLGQAVRRALGILDHDPPALRRQKLRARLARHLRGDDLGRVSAFLGELCGAPSSEQSSVELLAARRDRVLMGDQMRRAFEDFVEAECRSGPVIIVLEDLHWGDLPTVTWIGAALRRVRDLPLMVLGLARPSVNELFPGLWDDQNGQRIMLGGLSRKAAERLVREVLGDRPSPAEVAEIVARAAGNAFYLEELIRAVAEGKGDALPETVLAMTEARLNRLDPQARRVLRAASVFGTVFHAAGVAALLGEDRSSPDPWLDVLVEREMVAPRPDREIEGGRAYAFRHAFVRDAAYAMLTEEDRRLGHRLAAAWLLGREGQVDAVVLAEHLERGGELHGAVAWYERAAEQALSGNDLRGVLTRARRGVDCGAEGEALGRLLVLRAEAHAWLGETTEAIADADRGIALLAEGGPEWLGAISLLARLTARVGDYDRLGAIGAIVLDLAERDAGAPCAIACARVGLQLLFAGRNEAACALIDRAERASLAASPPDPAIVASVSRAKGYRAMFAGDLGVFMEMTELQTKSCEQMGDIRLANASRQAVACAYTELGAYAAAERALREVLVEAERMNLREIAALARANLANALALQGSLDEAREALAEALAFAESHSQPRLEGGCRTYLARILFFASDARGAEREARAAAAIPGVAPPARALALAELGRALLVQGRALEALEVASEARRLALSPSGVEEGESLIHLVYIEALAAAGRAADRGPAIAIARDRLLERAAKISDPGWREKFLTQVVDNARIVELGGGLPAAPPSPSTIGSP